MAEIDKRGRLEDDEPFSYIATKDGKILLYWQGRLIKTLKGKPAQKFLQQISGLSGVDEQLVMAKATGHFKHGNERTGKQRE